MVILVRVSGKVKGEEIKVIIGNKLDEEKTKYNIIIPKISETSIELAKKYNITESKAAYLEEVINKYTDIKIEDIKDMSIGDIIDKTEEVSKSEEDDKKVASMMGASVGTGKYCDKLAP